MQKFQLLHLLFFYSNNFDALQKMHFAFLKEKRTPMARLAETDGKRRFFCSACGTQGCTHLSREWYRRHRERALQDPDFAVQWRAKRNRQNSVYFQRWLDKNPGNGDFHAERRRRYNRELTARRKARREQKRRQTQKGNVQE